MRDGFLPSADGGRGGALGYECDLAVFGGLRAAFLAPLTALAGILVCILIEGMMAGPGSKFLQR